MTKWTAAMAAGLLLLGAAGPSHAQGKFPDVSPDHWAFQTVEDLANAGLVLGYPDGRFLGNRTLTRYEMATIIKRVVDNLSERMRQGQAAPPAPGQPSPPAAPGVTPAQLAQVNKLIEEFKTELTVIGADLAAIKEQLSILDQDVVDLKNQVNDQNDFNIAQQSQIDLINRKRIDGYVQARYVYRATDSAARAPENVGTDTTRGLNGNRDTFNVRRARINIRGDVTDRSAYRVQLDAGSSSGSSSAVAIKEAYVSVKNVLNTSFLTSDLWLGQSVTPFGFYLVYSSSDRFAPERYIAFSDTGSGLFPNQDYDKGVALRGRIFGRYPYHIGLYNGTGTASNDLGRRKDFIGQIGIPLTPNWNIGISGYDGEGANTGTPIAINPTNTGTFVGPVAGPNVAATRRRVKSLIGFDTQYVFPFGARLNLEYVRGKGSLSGAAANTVPTSLKAYVDAATVEGYYAELGYNLGSRVTLVGAYEYFNRNADPADSGPLSAFNGVRVRKSDFAEERAHFGMLYFFDSATRFRLWYEAPLNYPNPPGGPEGGSGSSVSGRSGIYTAEIQVKF